MKKKIAVVSGILAATLSFPALAQVYAPDWFSVKHPEIKRMDALRAQAAVGGSAYTLAAGGLAPSTSAPGVKTDWADLKHPELRTMARMRTQEAARDRLAMHGAVAHHVGGKSAGPTHRS